MEEKPTPTAEAMTQQTQPPTADASSNSRHRYPRLPGFDAEEYFGGKTIRIITGTSPGGGYDTFSRIVAATG